MFDIYIESRKAIQHYQSAPGREFDIISYIQHIARTEKDIGTDQELRSSKPEKEPPRQRQKRLDTPRPLLSLQSQYSPSLILHNNTATTQQNGIICTSSPPTSCWLRPQTQTDVYQRLILRPFITQIWSKPDSVYRQNVALLRLDMEKHLPLKALESLTLFKLQRKAISSTSGIDHLH